MRSHSMAGATLNSLGLQVTFTRLRSMGSADCSGMPSTEPSSSTPSSRLPPWRFANEQIVSKTSAPGWFPQRLNSRLMPSPCKRY